MPPSIVETFTATLITSVKPYLPISYQLLSFHCFCNCLLMAGADCGSVEFLFSPTDGRMELFDFNCLSTLPDAASYDELALHVLSK